MIIYDNEDGFIELYNYMQIPVNKISRIYSVNRRVVSNTLKRRGVDISKSKVSKKCGYCRKDKKYFFNEKFFDEIDTEEKAYIFGFFLADGSNIVKENTIYMCLQSEDKYILERINQILDSNRPLRHINPPKRFPHRKHQDSITLYSPYFSKRLEDIGMCSMKSYLLKFPSCIPEHLMNHFIRGYFDGDGSIYQLKNSSKYGFSFVGTEDFIINLKYTLMKYCGLSDVKIHTRFPERNNTTRYISYSGRKQTIRFGEWLYKDATIYLTRKLDKFPQEVKHLIGLTTQ